jgi:tetratricopeptide (TPR) repeat protein
MNDHFERGTLLFSQRRFALAEKEFRAGLGEEPDNPMLHAYLGLCLARQERYTDGAQQVRTAIEKGPDLEFCHWALADILQDQGLLDEAVAAIEEAIRLDPEDAANRATLSHIRLDQGRFSDALAAADAGLEIDPENVRCLNLRGIALVRLNRLDEAAGALEIALKEDPENAMTHVHWGHVLLHEGKHQEAMGHFREALRIEPSYEQARDGILTAMKARNPLYRFALWYLLLTSRAGWLGQLATWGVLIAFIGSGELAKIFPNVGPWVYYPIAAVVLPFWVLLLVQNAVFNLLLRFDRLGRLALSEDEIAASNWTALCMLVAIGAGIAFLATSYFRYFALAIVALFSITAIEQTFASQPGKVRRMMLGYLALLALVGVWTVVSLRTTPALVFMLGSMFSEEIAEKVTQSVRQQ